MKYSNLGCGPRFHPDWVNIDRVSSGEGVIAHDLSQGIPLSTDSFEVVYHSHLLEHFPKADALPFLKECHRILLPRGIIRVVVPDLEKIARIYLTALERASAGEPEWTHHYEWIKLELFDQTVRERPGGEMAEYLRGNVPNLGFVLDRIGLEGRHIREASTVSKNGGSNPKVHGRYSIRVLRSMYQLFRNRSLVREKIVRHLLRTDYELLELGRFRRGGEIHLWMHDRYSLSRLLENAGFSLPQVVSPAESQIPNWKDYCLDTEPDGSVYKPDSLYMEAIKT